MNKINLFYLFLCCFMAFSCQKETGNTLTKVPEKCSDLDQSDPIYKNLIIGDWDIDTLYLTYLLDTDLECKESCANDIKLKQGVLQFSDNCQIQNKENKAQAGTYHSVNRTHFYLSFTDGNLTFDGEAAISHFTDKKLVFQYEIKQTQASGLKTTIRYKYSLRK